jgi:hypothetical protein
MSKELTPAQFVKKLTECIAEYKKQQHDTRDDHDSAHFFNPSLKKFLLDYQREVTDLSTLNFERAFINWMKSYLLK